MELLKSYWIQIKAFYKTLWRQVFAKERQLEGPLSGLTLKQGFLWDLIDYHKWVVLALAKTLGHVFQCLFGYVAAIVLILLFVLSWLIILIGFPFFSIRHQRKLQEQAEQL